MPRENILPADILSLAALASPDIGLDIGPLARLGYTTSTDITSTPSFGSFDALAPAGTRVGADVTGIKG